MLDRRLLPSVALTVVLGSIVGVVLLLSRRDSVSVPMPGVDAVSLDDTETRVSALETGSYDPFVRQPIASRSQGPTDPGSLADADLARLEPLNVETLGTLTAEERVRFEDRLREFADAFLVDLDALQKNMLAGEFRPAEAAFKEAEVIRDLFLFRSVADAVAQGSYFLTADEYEIEPPQGYQLHATNVLKGGRYVVANVVLKLDDFPDYTSAIQEQRAVRQVYLAELVDVFNRKNPSERMELIARRDQIRARGTSTTEDMEFLQEWFPRGIRVVDDILVVERHR